MSIPCTPWATPEPRKTARNRAIQESRVLLGHAWHILNFIEKLGGASEVLVLRVAKPMSGLGVARAGGVQEPLHSKGLPCVQGSNRWVYVRADVQAETWHLFEEALDNLDL